MPAPDPFAPFLEPLERLELPYCITGSVAASVYGEPRLIADKHIRDIRFIRAATALDRPFLEREIARLGVGAEWQKTE